MPPRKSQRTKVRTGVTTGTAVAMLFLSASAAFAAAAMTSSQPLLGAVRRDKADLLFKNVTASIVSATNPVLQVSALYYNDGRGESGGHMIAYRFLDASRQDIGSVSNLSDQGSTTYPTLRSKSSRQINTQITTVPPEASFIEILLDSDGRVLESDKNNNDTVVPITGRVPGGSGLPDFVFSALPAPSFSNGVLNYRWGNDGTGGGTFIAGQVEVRTESLDASGRVIGLPVDFIAPATPVGNSATFPPHQMEFTGGAGYTPAVGATEIRITLDPDNRVVESSENNNVAIIKLTGAVTVTSPRVLLSPVSPAGASVSGLGEVLRFTVNTGNTPVSIRSFAFKLQGTDNTGTRWPERALSGVWGVYDTMDFSQSIPFADGATNNSSPGVVYDSASANQWTYRRTLMEPQVNNQAFVTIAPNSSKTFFLKVDTTGAGTSSSGPGNVLMPTLENIYWRVATANTSSWQQLSVQIPTNVIHY